MTLPIIDKQRAFAALDDSVARFVGALRSVPEATKPALGVWNISDVAAHVSHLLQMFPAVVRGEGSPVKDHRKLPQWWRERVGEDPERDIGVVSDRIERGAKDLKEALDLADWTSSVPWHGGIPLPAYSLAGIAVNEAEMHGLDIATAAGIAWSIRPDHARLSIDAHLPSLPHFVDPEKAAALTGVCEIRIRGGSRVYFRFERGRLSITSERPKGRVRCHLSADPVAYMLTGYRRTSPVRLAFTGKVFSWGTSPWMALQIPKVFYSV